ncbi:MAG: small basic protein [Planctomycetes bacterium]|nr:small basic protein [Planctomycetota bacterium]
MSIHSSLRGTSSLIGERSVLTRQERILKLEKAGKFDASKRSAIGLPKVRTKFRIAGAKKAEKAKPAEGAAAAPAAGAAPAAKGKEAAAPAKGKK